MALAQQRIAALLTELTFSGREHGLQVTAYLDGRLIVDAWAGTADVGTGTPVDGDTLFPVFSTTKGITATLIHQLAEEGKLDYADPVAHYWPAYGAHGKAEITIGQVLAHTAGVPQMPVGMDATAMADWDRMNAALAALSPLWPPGSRQEYHAISFGNILGEVAQRVTGQPFGALLRDRIAAPLGVEDLYVGIPDAVDARVALLTDAQPMEPQPEDGTQAIPGGLWPLHAWMHRADARRACFPASNGIMTARAIARHYAALLPGGVEGVELLPPTRVRLATQRQYPDGWTGEDVPTFALGYALGLLEIPSAFGHSGFGGSTGFADPDTGLAVGVTKNYFNPDDNTGLIVRTLRECL
ncbi:MAG TPA: serine hydrolase domain-containing protein [Armatimonadota bacterium]